MTKQIKEDKGSKEFSLDQRTREVRLAKLQAYEIKDVIVPCWQVQI